MCDVIEFELERLVRGLGHEDVAREIEAAYQRVSEQRADLEDAVLDAVVWAFEKPRHLRHPERVRAFVKVVIRRSLQRRYRRTREMALLDEPIAPQRLSPFVEDLLELALGSLKRDEWILFQFLSEKVPYLCLASVYGMTRSALETKVWRLRKRMREALAEALRSWS